MVVNCCVVGCKIRGGKNISFHVFPKDPEIRWKWIKNINRADPKTGNLWIPQKYKNDKVCEKHFLPSDFLPKMLKKILKKEAIPTIFPTCPIHFNRRAKLPFKRSFNSIPTEPESSSSTSPKKNCHSSNSTTHSEMGTPSSLCEKISTFNTQNQTSSASCFSNNAHPKTSSDSFKKMPSPSTCLTHLETYSPSPNKALKLSTSPTNLILKIRSNSSEKIAFKTSSSSVQHDLDSDSANELPNQLTSNNELEATSKSPKKILKRFTSSNTQMKVTSNSSKETPHSSSTSNTDTNTEQEELLTDHSYEMSTENHIEKMKIQIDSLKDTLKKERAEKKCLMQKLKRKDKMLEKLLDSLNEQCILSEEEIWEMKDIISDPLQHIQLSTLRNSSTPCLMTLTSLLH